MCPQAVPQDSPTWHWPRRILGTGIAALSVLYMVLQVGFVQPYLWPAGHGFAVTGEARFGGASGTGPRVLARPPDLTLAPARITVEAVAPGSPAEALGLEAGATILSLRRAGDDHELDLRPLASADPVERLRIWRSAYWLGLRGPVELAVERGGEVSRLRLDRPSAFASGEVLTAWSRMHFGMIAQICVFVLTAVVLVALRSTTLTATLVALALALCGVGGGGPLSGAEGLLPPGLREVMTVYAWIAAPLAFPLVALAILHFPAQAAVLRRAPWLHAVPFVAAAPMMGLGLATGLYLAGVEVLSDAAVWDASHPAVYYGSFAAALAVNVLAIIEGIFRYKRNPDPIERRRIRVVVVTAVPGVLAYAVKEGLPTLTWLATGVTAELHWALRAALHLGVLLPAFGLAIAVVVHRVLAPRIVIRQSLQYALARKTLTLLTVLPAAALAASLVRHRDAPIGVIVSGEPGFYIVTIGLLVGMLRYRERAQIWLDQRFFRQEYDARKILVSLAARVRFETDPNDLSNMVVDQIDEALHPKTVAILVGGLEPDELTPVAILHGSAESLRLDGALITMLRWSDEPLEIYLDDPRSAARRLPQSELDWLTCTGAALLVPVVGRDRGLVGVIALGEKRSEERYTAEDKELLASIAGQMALGLDVARLRQRAAGVSGDAAATMTGFASTGTAMMECPSCGRCADAPATTCTADGTAMIRASAVPRVIDDKYRIDQLLGRGGMGAVYRARDVRLDRDVAIKVVRADLLGYPEARRRFRREAQIVARLQHPSIVSIFDYGTLGDGAAYLVMELVRGEDLRRMLTRERRLPAERVCRVIRAICEAIEVAHQEGVLHRDLKPENILLPPAGAEVKVLDFGVAKLVAERQHEETGAVATLTEQGALVGTPAYMAPEQLRGVAIDVRTDVFALGVIAFEMLTGELPFGKGGVGDIALRQIQGAPLIRTLAPDLPADLERAVQAALQTDAHLRPASAAAFGSLLHGAVPIA